ncbi:MAG: sugar phosphate isomerase/epimerase [Oscillospiraceae bacterium]|nr:sugar phosphate isomerase/epimerase [Oscillospiraceae bacterium]
MKYSLMTINLGFELARTEPTAIQLEICADLGKTWETKPSIDEVVEFLASKGLPAKKGTMSFEDLAKFASESGFDGIDFMGFDFNIPGDEAKQILDQYNIAISGCCIIVPFVNARSDEEFNALYESTAAKMTELAKAGAKTVLIMPTMMRHDPDLTDEQVFANMLRGMKACAAHGEKLGMNVCMETLESAYAPLGNTEELQRFFDAVPSLKYAHDTGNMYVKGDDCLHMYEAFKEKIASVHFKDMGYVDHETAGKTADGRYIALCEHGKGLVDFPEQLRRLTKDGYEGFILLEGSVVHTGDVKVDAVETLKYFRQMEKEF